jgi:hypothetical protein
MSVHFKVILLIIGSQVFLWLLQLAVFRSLPKSKIDPSPLLIAVKCALFVNIPLLLVSWVMVVGDQLEPYDRAWTMAYILLTYNGFAYSYCHIFNMSETSRRIRVLYELSLAGRLRYEELAHRYGDKNIFDARIERLVTMRQIEESNRRFVLKSRLLYVIGVIVLGWGSLLKYGPSGKEMLDRCTLEESTYR